MAHRAAEAGRRLPHPGEGRRDRRHLARQHLSRCCVRRAVAPVFVLVRAEAGLATCVLLSARDPRLPQRRRRQVRSASLHPRSTRIVDRAHWDDAEMPLARLHRVRAGVRRAVPDLRCRRAAHPVAARHRGHRRLRRARRSTPRSGTTASTWPASGSPSSAPAPAPSRSCPRSSKIVDQVQLYQRTAAWVMPRINFELPGVAATGVRDAFPGCAPHGGPRTYWTWTARAIALAKRPRTADGRRVDVQVRTCGATSRDPRAAAQADAALPRRLQANPDLRQLLSSRRRTRRPR